MYDIVDGTQLRTDISTLYNDPATVLTKFSAIHPHRASVIFVVFALGGLFSASDSRKQAYARFNASQKLLALSDTHFLAHNTLSACQALHLSCTFLFNTGYSINSRFVWLN